MINFFAVRLFCYKDISNCRDHDDQLPPRKEHLKVSDFEDLKAIARHGKKTLGVTVNAYSVSALNEITTNRIEMGTTGEVYHEISRFARNDSHRKIASG